MTIAAIVLAGGAGSRFVGDHKLVTPFRGRPLAAWAIEAALGSGADEVIVVTGAVDLSGLVSGTARIVANPQWHEGQATSLAVGIDAADAAGHAAAVVGLADQPLIPAEAWRRVTQCAESPIAVATYGGVRRNPVRFDRLVWQLLPREGDEGARGVLKSRPDLITEVACPGDPVDIDTQEDLINYEKGVHNGDDGDRQARFSPER
jgi:molybdenum cofactor cytidylyltransferase